MKRQRQMRKGSVPGAVKLEQLEQRQLLSTSLSSGVLEILTAATADVISITQTGSDLQVDENGARSVFATASVTKIWISTGSGNDKVSADGIAIAIEADLGNGNDTLVSGAGADTIRGGSGADLIVTGGGDDVIYGDSGNDRLSSGDGADTITGGSGSDIINSGIDGGTVYDTGRNINRGKGRTFIPASYLSYQPEAYLSNVVGYDPNQIRRAYGFPELDALQDLLVENEYGQWVVDVEGLSDLQRIYRRGGELDLGDLQRLQTAWDYGFGQTIYIVNAYTGLNLLDRIDADTGEIVRPSDLTVFCDQFGLPTGNYEIVNANGTRYPQYEFVNGTGRSVPKSAPAINAGWAGEINLDMQWARAIAPAAKIVLVQAESDISVDMYLAVRRATTLARKAGGGVVSMSFALGGGSIYDPTLAGYDPTTTADMYLWDRLFRANQTVTYVAASGDSGSVAEAGWPAMSPYVTAVGGTTLQLNEDGARLSESAWIDGGSGYGLPDWYERPPFQDGIAYAPPIDDYNPDMDEIAPDANVRGVPDVSYNADPATPFAVYLSTPQDGDRGWFGVGGTSAGTPQWAAIVAIINAKRFEVGKPTVGNGFNGMLYDIYNGYLGEAAENYDEDNEQDYLSCFNDIIDGQAGPWLADDRYDMATGIGTPKASSLISTLANYDPFFLQDTFEFEASLFMPFSVQAGGLLPAGAGQRRTGTGSIQGDDNLLLFFETDPIPMLGMSGSTSTFTPVIVPDTYYDVEPGQASAFRVELQRTGRGDNKGRIYGKGNATIYNGDPRTQGRFLSADFTLKFEGRWWTGRDGRIHYRISFRAVDPVTYGELESGPASLVYDPTLASLGAYYAGEITG